MLHCKINISKISLLYPKQYPNPNLSNPNPNPNPNPKPNPNPNHKAVGCIGYCGSMPNHQCPT